MPVSKERLADDQAFALAHTGADAVEDCIVVQELWSGYGQVLRLRLGGGEVRSVVLKSVMPPDDAEHPRGFGGPRSHARKLRSYDVEMAFYQRFSSRVPEAARTAECLAASRTERGWRFLFEDLDDAGFEGRRQRLTARELDRCLDWLAAFHAGFVGTPVDGLWPVGTYWHLGTRPDEFEAMSPGPLRDAAAALDQALNRCRYPTLVHGDAKVANFCFGVTGVAAVDFQYTGGGCGMKDVAYFLSSCLSDAECETRAPALLDAYFEKLRLALPRDVDGGALEAEWRRLYPAAWADFHRFLAGWAPTHWKIHSYTERMTELALATL
ncbi:MAG: phosphotransferase [Myxococcota bacterium]